MPYTHWLTVADAAERASVSKDTIYQACLRQELQHVRAWFDDRVGSVALNVQIHVHVGNVDFLDWIHPTERLAHNVGDLRRVVVRREGEVPTRGAKCRRSPVFS